VGKAPPALARDSDVCQHVRYTGVRRCSRRWNLITTFYARSQWAADVSRDHPAGQIVRGYPTTCFASQCDWRLQRITEKLNSIAEFTRTGCGVAALVIDPVLWANADVLYWSSIQLAIIEPGWLVDFTVGYDSQNSQAEISYRRAVQEAGEKVMIRSVEYFEMEGA